MSANQVRSTVNKKNHQYSGRDALSLKSTYFAMQVAIDFPNVICSPGASVDEIAGLGVGSAAILAPQLPQNFTSSEFSLPHFGQNIFISLPLKIEPDNIRAHVV